MKMVEVVVMQEGILHNMEVEAGNKVIGMVVGFMVVIIIVIKVVVVIVDISWLNYIDSN